MTPLTADDVERLAGAEVERDSDEWLTHEGVTVEAMGYLFGGALRAFKGKIAEDGDVEGALVDVVGQSFRLGWACRGSR